MEPVEAPILIVDDREENRIAFEAILSPLGQPLLLATSGNEALRILLDRKVAAILMDVQMPGLDGVQTAELIRARPSTAQIPILFITALSRELNFVLRAYSEGAVDYLLKPVEPEILRAKVNFFVQLFIQTELARLRERELLQRKQAEAEALRQVELEHQVTAIVGHDIRSPLASIRAAAQLGIRTSGDQPHLTRLFERIEASTRRVDRISGTILDVTRARLGSGLPVQREVMCAAELTRTLIGEFEVVHPARRFHLQAPERSEGCWDPVRVSQLLTNLLENAVKYAAPESDISVALEGNATHAELRVRNRGPVVESHELDSLFEPYHRADHREERRSLGLGLFVVREIVRGHGGTVRAVALDDGMEFVVELPRELGGCDASDELVSA